jgi:hypothetical protein
LSDSPLKTPAFARLFGGQLLSQLGTAFSYVALMAKYRELHGSTDGWAWLAAVQTLPYFVFGFVFGYLADRGRQRLLLAGSDLVRAVLFVAIARCSGETELFVLAASVAVFNAAYDPAYRSTVTGLLPKGQLLAANALADTTFGVASIAGVGLSGIVLALVGTTGCFYFDAATYLVAALNTLSIAALRRPLAPLADVSAEPLRSRLLRGFVAIRRPALRYPVALALLLACIVGFEAPMFFPLAEANHWGGADRVGYIYALVAAGVLVTSIALARRSTSPLRDRRVVAIVLAIDATSILAFACLDIYLVVLPLSLVLGVTESLFRTYTSTEIQTQADADEVGRAFATLGMLSKSITVLASVGAGIALGVLGARHSFLLAGGAEYAAALYTLATTRMNRHVR